MRDLKSEEYYGKFISFKNRIPMNKRLKPYVSAHSKSRLIGTGSTKAEAFKDAKRWINKKYKKR